MSRYAVFFILFLLSQIYYTTLRPWKQQDIGHFAFLLRYLRSIPKIPAKKIHRNSSNPQANPDPQTTSYEQRVSLVRRSFSEGGSFNEGVRIEHQATLSRRAGIETRIIIRVIRVIYAIGIRIYLLLNYQCELVPLCLR